MDFEILNSQLKNSLRLHLLIDWSSKPQILTSRYRKTSYTFYVNNGNYQFKAVQRSGYAIYPTENVRSANISGVCQEVVLKVGF